MTSGGSVSPDSPVEISELTADLLSPDLVHLTYFATNQNRRTWRTSLWRRTQTGWRMYFHQGTPAE